MNGPPRKPREDNSNVPKNAPIFAMVSAALMLVGGVVVVLSGNGGKNDGSLLVGLVVTTIPSLIAAAFAERTSRDVRNGTVTEKARQGTHKALAEAGVTTVASQAPQTVAALQALTNLLEAQTREVTHNTDVTEAVADALDVDHERTPDNVRT